MAVNLSIKDVPDAWAQRLRQRAARNHRSLQGELMAIVERAAAEPVEGTLDAPRAGGSGRKSIEQIAAAARQRFPEGTSSSVDSIREMREARHGDAGAS